MKRGKSQGIDGLTSEFLKHFWADIKKLLYGAFFRMYSERMFISYYENRFDNLITKAQKRSADARQLETSNLTV